MLVTPTPVPRNSSHAGWRVQVGRSLPWKSSKFHRSSFEPHRTVFWLTRLALVVYLQVNKAEPDIFTRTFRFPICRWNLRRRFSGLWVLDMNFLTVQMDSLIVFQRPQDYLPSQLRKLTERQSLRHRLSF